MKKKSFLKAAILVSFFTVAVSGAFAQITISGGFALSNLSVNITGAGSELDNIEGDIGVGGNVYLDYLLPINIPLSLGFEVGVDSSTFTDVGTKDTVVAIPLLIRAAYHFDLMPKLDLYVVGKLGIAFGVWTGDIRKSLDDAKGNIETPIGVAFGFDVGAAYYFTPHIGIFSEVGFDDYALSAKFSIPESEYNDSTSGSVNVPFYRFLTLGLSFKK
jgi:hypothetical protein